MWFFFQEVKALQNAISNLQKVKHERIVSYCGSQQIGGYLHLFMEFMPGVRALMGCVPSSSIGMLWLFHIGLPYYNLAYCSTFACL